MQDSMSINCPRCGESIDIKSLYAQEMERTIEAQKAKLAKENEAEKKALQQQAEALQKRQMQIDAEIEQQAQQQLKSQQSILEKSIKERLLKEQELATRLLKEELEQKSRQLSELHEAKAKIEMMKLEQEAIRSKAKSEAQKELASQFEALKKSYFEEVQKEHRELLEAKEEQIRQMQRDIESAKQKAQQGSMQIQGEAQEFQIEQWLEHKYPFDVVKEVKKGAFGADCIEYVNTRELRECGIICYESKQTKSWSDGWISKLKQDMLRVNADIGVIVTSVYPPKMEQMGFVEGIWVCTLEEFKGSVALLREALIRTKKIASVQENRGDKQALLYSYLTSNEFTMQLQAIVDGFIALGAELEKEKRAMQASWKRRQKQIEQVLDNTTAFYGSLQAIAGRSAVGEIEALELETLPAVEEL